MYRLANEYRLYFTNRRFVLSALGALALFALSLAASYYAISFSGTHASNSVTDLILSNTRVYNVDGIFVYGSVCLVLFAFVMILLRPRYIPFAVKTVALFFIIRSGFVVLTHVSPYPEHVAITASYFTTSVLFKSFFTGDDLFFSGHTGLPFLLAFLFWDSLPLRLIFIAVSILFGAVVLLGHIHYSIDVAAAFFIVPTIFAISKKVFKTDFERRLFHN